MVSVKVYCMKINWYSTHHRIVYSQYHCKSVTNILAKPIFVCRNSTLNRSHYTMWKICAPTAFRRMKNANDNRMLWKTKRADHQIYLIEKFGSTQHRKLHALMYLILFFSKTVCFFHSAQRQNSLSSSHEVPYARLIDSPNRKQAQTGNNSTPISVDSDPNINRNRSIRMPTPKSSVSESKLTVDYFQKSDISVWNSKHSSLLIIKICSEKMLEFEIFSKWKYS